MLLITVGGHMPIVRGLRFWMALVLAIAGAGIVVTTSSAASNTSQSAASDAPLRGVVAKRAVLRKRARAGASPATVRRRASDAELAGKIAAATERKPHTMSASTLRALAKETKRSKPTPLKVTPTFSAAPKASAFTRLAAAAATPPRLTPPFTECPPIGNDTGGCGILIEVTDSGYTVLADGTEGPYDGSDDTLVGVVNLTGKPVSSLLLSSQAPIFGFDGDGLCTVGPVPPGCPFPGSTGYEGPGVSFAVGSSYGGKVNFATALQQNDTAYFALEDAISASEVFKGAAGVQEVGGAANPSENVTVCYSHDPVNCATGQLVEQVTDVAVPGRGVPLALTRTYTSGAAATDGPFGHGWSFTYGMSLTVDATSGDVTVHQEDGSIVAFRSTPSGLTAPPRVLASLQLQGDGTYLLTRKKTNISYHFSASGQLLDEADRHGYTMTLAYAGGQLATVTDPAGRQLTLTWTGGRITGVSDPLGRTTAYAYDANGDLATVTDAGGRATHYGYDASHRLTTVTAPGGGVTTNTYDSSGRVTKQVDAAGLAQTFAYTGDASSDAGGTTTITDAHGAVTVETYADLQLFSVVHGAGTPSAATTSYTYDPATLGRLTTTDPNGHVTMRTFDLDGNVLSSTDPLGRTSYFSYNGFDELTRSFSPAGTDHTYGYNATGDLVSATDGVGATTTYAYDDAAHPGDVTTVTDPDGRVATYPHDGFGDLASESVSPSSGVTRTVEHVYDGDGELLCTAPPAAVAAGKHCPAPGGTAVGGTIRQHYDASGRLTGTTDATGATTTYTYDADGDRTGVTDPDGHTATTTYDALHRALTVVRRGRNVGCGDDHVRLRPLARLRLMPEQRPDVLHLGHRSERTRHRRRLRRPRPPRQ